MQYYLFQPETQNRVGPLTIVELREKVLAFSKSELKTAQIWATGWDAWRRLSDTAKEVLRPLEGEGLKISISDDSDLMSEITKVKAIESSYQEKRKHWRYNLRFEVKIRSAGGEWTGATKNVSLGGVALTESIPVNVLGAPPPHIAIYLSGDHFVEFELRQVSPKDGTLYAFVNPELKDLEILEVKLKELSQKKISRPKLKL